VRGFGENLVNTKDSSPHPPPRDPGGQACGEKVVTTEDSSPHAPAPPAVDALRETGGVSDPAVIVVADLHGLTGRVDELSGLLRDLAAGARTERECVEYRVLTDHDEPGDFVLISSWESEAGLRAHYTTVHYRVYRSEVAPLLARPSDVVVHRVSSTVHALDPNPPDPGLFG